MATNSPTSDEKKTVTKDEGKTKDAGDGDIGSDAVDKIVKAVAESENHWKKPVNDGDGVVPENNHSKANKSKKVSLKDCGDLESVKVKHLKTDDSGIGEDRSLNMEDSPFSEDASKESEGERENKSIDSSVDTEDSEVASSQYEMSHTGLTSEGESGNTPDGAAAEAKDPASEEAKKDEIGEEGVDDSMNPSSRRSSDSSSTSSGPDEDGIIHSSSSSSTSTDDETDEEMQVDENPVKDTWWPVRELRNREFGMSPRYPASLMFRRRTSCSLSMVQRLTLQHRMEGHDGCVNALHFNKSGTLIASGSDDLNIIIWDWARNKPYLEFNSGHRSNVFQSKFMPYCSDTHIVSCARDGQVRLAELSATGVCKSTRRLAQHRGAAHKLALLQDSSHEFYSCGEDAAVFEIDLRTEKPNKLCITKEGDTRVPLYSVHANPFKTWEFCVGGRDHYIRIYDKRMLGDSEGQNGLVKKYCPHHLVDSDIKANVTCAVYNYNGTEILGSYNDEHIYLFDDRHSDGAEYIKRYTGHRNNNTVKGVNFYGPKSEYIISGSDCSNIFIWEKQTEKVVQYFHGDDGGVVNVLEPHPHSPILATSGLDHDVKIWYPSSEEGTKMSGLSRTMRRNQKDREEERVHEPEMIDGQMLWLLMHQIRRNASRRARNQEGEEGNLSGLSSDNSSDNEDDDDDDDPIRPQCVPS